MVDCVYKFQVSSQFPSVSLTKNGNKICCQSKVARLCPNYGYGTMDPSMDMATMDPSPPLVLILTTSMKDEQCAEMKKK